MTTPIADDTWNHNKFDPSYAQGCKLTYLSTTTLSMAAGNWRDQSAQAQITLSSSVTINAANAGVVNGIDTGALGASSWYYVHLIGSSLNQQSTGALLSLSATAPTLPTGYDMFRVVGAVKTDGSSLLLSFYQSGAYFQFDAPIAVTVTSSGTSASYSAMDLSTGVPPVQYARARLKYKWTPNAAADALNFTPSGGTGDFETSLGQVASVAMEDAFSILPLTVSSVPKVSYKISAGTLNNVWVQGFEMAL
jgi:hypothetical protein